MKNTKEENEILVHTLGLHRAEKSYRNHFVTGKGSKDFTHCESLVAKGLMLKRIDPFNEMEISFVYNATKKGEEAAREYLETVENIAQQTHAKTR